MSGKRNRVTCALVLAACAFGIGGAVAQAQTAPALPNAPSPSKVDVFVGYSYFAPHDTVNGFKYSSVDYGAIASGAYFVNKYAGGQIELGVHPDGNNDGFTSVMAGPIFRLPLEDITPFAHFLVGANRIGGPHYQPYTWGASLEVGGGLDYAIPYYNNRFSLRVFQADYQYAHASFGPAYEVAGGLSGGRANIKSAQLSTGIVVHFGTIAPPPPVTYACSASPVAVYPGDPVTVTGTAGMLNPKKTPTYSWTSTGGKVTGPSNVANVDTTGLSAGSYTVSGHVSEGAKAGQSADCTAGFTVKAYEPPTISCSASPSTVKPGDSSTITASGVSPQNRPLTYSYSASAGSVSGSGSTATLSTTGAAQGAITVTCNVVDDKGQSASATTTVSVEAPPAPVVPKTQALCSITFDRDAKRPTRVDNEAKACLDDVALNLQRSADAKAVVVGNSASDEKLADKKAAERAVNTKAYLTGEKGIDPSRISVYTGSSGSKEVKNYLVPSGASFETDVTGDTKVDESAVKAHPRKEVVKKHKKKKAE